MRASRIYVYIYIYIYIERERERERSREIYDLYTSIVTYTCALIYVSDVGGIVIA